MEKACQDALDRAAQVARIAREQKRIDDILSTEYSPKFDEMRKNSRVVSFDKYGEAKKNYARVTAPVSAMTNLKARIEMFEKTGNKDYLVDIANFAMLEFMYGKGAWSPTDSTDRLVGVPIKEIEDWK